jgi:hypothetical protein
VCLGGGAYAPTLLIDRSIDQFFIAFGPSRNQHQISQSEQTGSCGGRFTKDTYTSGLKMVECGGTKILEKFGVVEVGETHFQTTAVILTGVE